MIYRLPGALSLEREFLYLDEKAEEWRLTPFRLVAAHPDLKGEPLIEAPQMSLKCDSQAFQRRLRSTGNIPIYLKMRGNRDIPICRCQFRPGKGRDWLPRVRGEFYVRRNRGT
jgi:hypothetical protein